MSCVAMMLEFLKLDRDPNARTIGLTLTKSHMQWLHTTTSTLITLLSQQLTAIPLLYFNDPSFTRKLKAIQERQYRFQNTMTLVLDTIRPSTELWLRELDDGQPAILRKIKWCNRMSLPANLGIRDAALKYWPLIADSYTLLLTNLERLAGELEDALDDEALWMGRREKPKSEGRYVSKPNSKGEAVYFFKDVRARWIPGIEQADNEGEETKKFADFVMPLTNGRKRGKAKLKARQNMRGEGYTAEGVEEGGSALSSGDGESARSGETGREVHAEMEIAPLPL
ncbi:hypothetical protein BKA63DRAFT_559213 [Paraphoma chrysanthemicola]|nr:hypothetical protein BKA63DRAFT_559213 [Paraphoma chrysanthemicola]